MSSVRAQIFAAVFAKLAEVVDDLGWTTLLRNPRDPVGEDQLNAIVILEGGDAEPMTLTGHVEVRDLTFVAAWFVQETATDAAEDLLDEGYVAISNALLDPNDIQLGGVAIAIAQGTITDPVIGRSLNGGRVLGAQSIDFTVQYLAREGDASTPGP